MFFRSLCCMLLSATLLWLGCARKNESTSVPIVVRLQGADCVSDLSRKIHSFVAAEMSGEEVSDYFACISQALHSYQDLTSGDGRSDHYTAQGLRRFIQHYFVPNNSLSDRLLASIMDIKRILLSGSNQILTRNELDKMQDLIVELREIILLIQPHARIIFHIEPHATDSEVRVAAEAMKAALIRLGLWLHAQNQTYTFHQLNGLIAALSDTPAPATIQSKLKQFADLLPSLKAILVSGDVAGISGDEWLTLSQALGNGSYALLAAKYALDESLDTAVSRLSLLEGIGSVADVLELGVRRHPQGEIPISEWNTLFVAIESSTLLPSNYTSGAMNDLWRWFLRRLLGDGNSQATGLNLTHLEALRRPLSEWQQLLRTSPDDPSPVVQGFNQVVLASPPQVWDGQGRMVFPVKSLPTWTDANRRRLVWSYVLVHWLKNAYVGGVANSMSEANMDVAATEVLPLLKSFGWLQTTRVTIGRRILREADLFTDAGNGDGQIDLNEATRYLALVGSAFRAAQIWLNAADTICNSRAPDCVRSVGLKSDPHVLDSMPRLQLAMADWKSGQAAEYMKQAEQTVLSHVVTNPFATSDLLEVWMLFSYVEGFIQRFDADHNERIDLSEATVAFGLYGPTLSRLLSSTGVPTEQLMAFFTFMMNFGDTPFSMWGGQIAFINWKFHSDSWSFQAERSTLMSIMNQLSKL